jgi:intracellular sulfur oxidation DsrE/DsrF family protein
MNVIRVPKAFFIFLFLAIGVPQAAVAAPDKADTEITDEWVAPVITRYGKVKPYPDAAVQLRPDHNYKIVFDITKSASGDGKILPGLEHIARFVNLAGLAKVPAKNQHLVAILHGQSTSAVLSEKAYEARFDSVNPNAALIAALKKAGVEIMVCGQALAHKKFSSDEVASNVTVAVAALTVLAEYQMDGYVLIPD